MSYTNETEVPKILVGTKSDLLTEIPENQYIKEGKIKAFLKQKELDAYITTSSLKNYNVVSAFKQLNNLMLVRKNIPFNVL